MEKLYYPQVDEQIYRGGLKNGLSVLIVPRPGFQKKLCYLAVDYGSIHRKCEIDGESFEAPMGVAHYLEHKLFDMPERDISAEFAELGGFPNAFTGYDMTAYHFSCTENFEKCLRLLLEFVSTPYFTDETVQIPENRKALTVKDIVAFADCLDVEDVRELLQRQIDYNMAIAQAGLDGSYGAYIGPVLLKSYGDTIHNKAKAWAAAGSDARMNGCELPVIINSGSGNQGITASVPVIVYARESGLPDEQLFRALALSNLVTIHLKTGIGSLSAYCGATSAGAGAGAGICYLHGGTYDDVSHTIVNVLAINSGMLCDGAKSSCAATTAKLFSQTISARIRVNSPSGRLGNVRYK